MTCGSSCFVSACSRRGRDGAVLDLDERFHLELAAQADLRLIARVLTDLRAFIRLIGVDALRQPRRMEQVIIEHQEILDAIERRDEPSAVAAMERHLTNTAAVLEASAT